MCERLYDVRRFFTAEQVARLRGALIATEVPKDRNHPALVALREVCFEAEKQTGPIGPNTPALCTTLAAF